MGTGCLMEGPVTDGGHNLDVGSSCGFTAGTDLQNRNPQLGALGNNGGPTPTQALAPGSPAVDAGGTCPAADGGVDQRGLPRFTPCDIGAYEVQDQTPVLTPAPGFTSTEGVSITAAVATLSDSDTTVGGDFTATINWGDGSQTAGTVAPVSGQPTHFTINGTHTYADEGNFIQTITVTDSDSGTVSTTSTATVVDAALAGTGGFTLTGTEGPTSILGTGTDIAPASGTVATFTDANPTATTADFTATIAWGDGSTSAGTVSGPVGGQFSVAGSHTYAEDGNYAITVTINDDGGSKATAASTASIADPPLPFLLIDITEDLLGG
jgi:PKD domain